jgi:glutaconyl-CoA decarboxylase
MSKRVTVIVEGREYIVEVGDLNESPIRATVNSRTYQVQTPHENKPAAGPETPAVKATPTAPEPVAPTPATNQEVVGPRPAAHGAAISAPMPGNIIEIRVKAGDSVQPGDVICILEAMKMNNMIYADQAGTIASVEVMAGQAVDYGAPLVIFQ